MMTNFTIFPNEGGIACKGYSSKSTTTKYLTTQREFDNLISILNSSNFKTKIGDNYIRITARHLTITLMEYKKIINHPILKELKKTLLESINKNGITTKPKNYQVNTKPNRTKSNGNAGKKVAAISGALMLSIIVGMTANKLTNSDVKIDLQDSVTVESQEISMQEADVSYGITSNENNNINPYEKRKPELREEIQMDMSDRTLTGYLQYEDLSDTKKAIETKDNYYDIFCECASAYGLDENLLLGIATQERGVHATSIDDGGAVGLMQIQYSVWLNEKLDYYEYNPNTQQYEYHTMIVTDEGMRGLHSNIHIGSKIFQKCLRMSNYNIPVAIQMYNQGYGAVKKIIETYAVENGKTFDDIINNSEDLGWLEYTYLKKGDKNYLRNVKKWIEENTFEIVNVKNGITVRYEFKNQ